MKTCNYEVDPGEGRAGGELSRGGEVVDRKRALSPKGDDEEVVGAGSVRGRAGRRGSEGSVGEIREEHTGCVRENRVDGVLAGIELIEQVDPGWRKKGRKQSADRCRPIGNLKRAARGEKEI